MGRRRREEEEEEEEEKKRSQDQANKVWNFGFLVWKTTLSMDFVWITWNLRLDMVNILSLNLGFC